MTQRAWIAKAVVDVAESVKMATDLNYFKDKLTALKKDVQKKH